MDGKSHWRRRECDLVDDEHTCSESTAGEVKEPFNDDDDILPSEGVVCAPNQGVLGHCGGHLVRPFRHTDRLARPESLLVCFLYSSTSGVCVCVCVLTHSPATLVCPGCARQVLTLQMCPFRLW